MKQTLVNTIKHFILIAASVVLLLSGCKVPVSHPQRPLGEVKLVSGPSNCDGHDCYEVEVSSPQLAEIDNALLKVGDPTTSPSRGTIMFMGGGNGTYLWGNQSEHAGRVIEELRAAGFRTVQLQWERGWLTGARGQSEGPARLASRPATVMRWVYDNLHQQDDDRAFCATGNSGGSMQISYTLAHYGQANIFDAVVLTGGPPFGRIDLGLIHDDPNNEQYWFDAYGTRVADESFGFPPDSTGPGARNDPSFRRQFQDASVSFGNWAYVYPETMVWFLFGENEYPVWEAQGMTYYNRLLEAGSPLVRLDTVSNTPHVVRSTKEGAEMIRDILLKECRRR
ncbi:MAG: hypothetical protein IIB44_04775 [Candidatus Marinimicrobia bacterium]|nr:hypothetical protein [Candidatus Neomarinimicrobiota bacterium]